LKSTEGRSPNQKESPPSLHLLLREKGGTPLAILGVKKVYLGAAFDEMQKKYGTIERHFSEGLGIGATKQKALRDLYLR
jgi:protein tyrosine/serine phosphatase